MLDRILNPAPTIYKWDNFFTGIVPGLVCPLLAFVFFYLLQMKDMSLQAFVHHSMVPDTFSKILSFGCIINLGVFFIFITRNYYNAARGVIGATILWGIPIIYIKICM